MEFLNPTALLLLVLLPIMAAFMMWRERARTRMLRQLGDAELIRQLVARLSPGRRRLKRMLWLVALAALIIALARPVWGVTVELVERQGTAVIVALDVSKSMDAQDIQPSRISRAKLDLYDLFAQLSGSNLGIILFAGEAYVYMPLTFDASAAQLFLDSVSTDAISMQGTAIAAAVERASEAFDTRTGARPVMIVASDGEDHEGDVQLAADAAAQSGIVIHTLGYGTDEGGIIPVYDAEGNLIDYKTDSTNELVQTQLQEGTLRDLAALTGGTYQQAGETGSDIDALVETINSADAGPLGEEIVTRHIERFGLFVLLALAALSLQITLPEDRQEDAA